MKIHEIHFYLVRVSDPFPPSLGSRYIHSCIPGLLPGDRCEIRCLPPQFLVTPWWRSAAPKTRRPGERGIWGIAW